MSNPQSPISVHSTIKDVLPFANNTTEQDHWAFGATLASFIGPIPGQVSSYFIDKQVDGDKSPLEGSKKENDSGLAEGAIDRGSESSYHKAQVCNPVMNIATGNQVRFVTVHDVSDTPLPVFTLLGLPLTSIDTLNQDSPVHQAQALHQFVVNLQQYTQDCKETILLCPVPVEAHEEEVPHP